MRLSDSARKLFAFVNLMQEQLTNVEFAPRMATVPANLRGQETAVFVYGLGLVVPIPDLEVDENGISATLSFDRKPFKTFVPWSSVSAIFGADGMGFRFGEDVVKDLEPKTEGNVVSIFKKRS